MSADPVHYRHSASPASGVPTHSSQTDPIGRSSQEEKGQKSSQEMTCTVGRRYPSVSALF